MDFISIMLVESNKINKNVGEKTAQTGLRKWPHDGMSSMAILLICQLLIFALKCGGNNMVSR